MLGRDYRLAFAIALAILLSAATAFADVTFNPTSANTGNTTVGQTSTGVTVSVNKGTGSATVALTIGGCTGGGGTFKVNGLDFPQNVSAPVDVTITYIPSAQGTRTCTVTGANNQPGDATLTASGTGVVPPMISVTTPSAFPNARVLDTSVAAHNTTRQVTVQNDGGSVLNITNVTFTGDFSIDPSSLNGTTTTINGGGGAKNWILRFNPSASGARTGDVTFASNAGNVTIPLSGTGTTGSYAITQAANGAFGTVASGSSAGLDIAVTHDGLDPKGPLNFSTVTISNATQPWFAISAQPTNQITGAIGQTTGTITVTCSPPAGATATATATVNIQADADTGAMKTQAFSCTGGASVLALSIATVDMDPTLVNTTSPSKTLMVMNSGTSDAMVGFASASTNGPRFTVMGPGGCGMGANNCAVAMGGGTVMLTVTFSPTVEGTVSASFNVQGAGAAPSFIVNGRGIDRKIVVPDSVQFADEFRNPGSLATPGPVTVKNEGEYPIAISNLQIGNGSEVWSIVDPIPTMIPGLGSVDVMIKFAPKEAGKASDGQLLIVNDDPKIASGMPIVILSGNGKDRNVDMTPGTANVGETFTGIPTQLSVTQPEGFRYLTIKNNEMPQMDEKTDFTMSRIEITGEFASMFEIVGLDGDRVDGKKIKAGESIDVDVRFNPTYPGEFYATLALYLDQDEQPQPPVTVRGRALYIDAHGSGGCSTGRDSRGGVLALLAALGLVLRRRRR